jgi:hypothetical protein
MKQQYLKALAFGGVVALSMVAVPSAVAQVAPQILSLDPTGNTDFELGAGGGTEIVTFDINVSGLSSATLVTTYDFGVIYDPAVMTLNSFSEFGPKLGNPNIEIFPGFPQVFNQDYLDNTNDSAAVSVEYSTWDYRSDSTHTGLGAYTGPVLGTPDITGLGIINEGSLRFSQISNLSPSELELLQDPQINDSFTLFSLTFIVDTSQSGSTEILFVDDRSYAGWPNQPGGEMDFKLTDGFTPTYLTLKGSGVSVPLPGTLLLMVFGLFIGKRFRDKKVSLG